MFTLEKGFVLLLVGVIVYGLGMAMNWHQPLAKAGELVKFIGGALAALGVLILVIALIVQII